MTGEATMNQQLSGSVERRKEVNISGKIISWIRDELSDRINIDRSNFGFASVDKRHKILPALRCCPL
jgi:hypothetical protein